jgi:carboxylate-amine ligase
VQALVAHYVAADQAGETLPLWHPVLTHENKWRAARYGLRATVIDLKHGGPIPITQLIERTLREIAPDARAIGCDRELGGARRIVRDGNGADRQLAVYAATGDPREVARDIADVTQAGSAAE